MAKKKAGKKVASKSKVKAKPAAPAQQDGQVCYTPFATNATWQWIKPISSGGNVTLVVVTGGPGSQMNLTVQGNVNNIQNGSTRRFKAKIFPASATSPFDPTGATEFSGATNPLTGTVSATPTPDPINVSPIPANQKYQVVVWPGETTNGNPPVTSYSTTEYPREFHITHINQ